MNRTLFQASSLLIRGVAAFALLAAAQARAEPVAVAGVPPHANGEHPAVRVTRLASSRGIDSNTFIVLPPASVTWTLGPAAEPALRLADGSLAEPRSVDSH